MNDDLIFLLLTNKEWEMYKKGTIYSPESLESQGFIECLRGSQLKDAANRLYQGAENLMLVVINTSLLEAKLKYEREEELDEVIPHIYGPLNTDAIIDKIELAPEEDGTFDINFSEN